MAVSAFKYYNEIFKCKIQCTVNVWRVFSIGDTAYFFFFLDSRKTASETQIFSRNILFIYFSAGEATAVFFAGSSRISHLTIPLVLIRNAKWSKGSQRHWLFPARPSLPLYLPQTGFVKRLPLYPRQTSTVQSILRKILKLLFPLVGKPHSVQSPAPSSWLFTKETPQYPKGRYFH